MVPPQFRSIFAAGETAVRTGEHGIETDPRSTGRWGPSIVLLPTGDLAHLLDDLTSEAAAVAGRDHWLSGGPGRAHVTVRALEPFADAVDPAQLERYRSALGRALHDTGPLLLTFGGLGLSTGSLMVCAEPIGTSADALRQRLGTELGADGWLEDGLYPDGRDPIWYCSILHYAEKIAHPERLIDWVEVRADAVLGSQTFESVHIARWEHNGTAMAPHVLASVTSRGQ